MRYLPFLILIFIILYGCKKKDPEIIAPNPPPINEYFSIDPALKAYGDFKNGSYWIYTDQFRVEQTVCFLKIIQAIHIASVHNLGIRLPSRHMKDLHTL
jgi:hypothetical protein